MGAAAARVQRGRAGARHGDGSVQSKAKGKLGEALHVLFTRK